MPVVISKAIRGTSLGTGTADTQMGAATQKAPEWAREFLGFKVGGTVTTPTSTQAAHAQARVASNDFACYPSTVPVLIAQGSIATAANQNSMILEYWPCDWPIHGGDAYDLYMQAQVANTVAPYGVGMTWFGDGEGIMPSREDPYPHTPRFHLTSGSAAAASASQALAAFTITGSKAIVEFNGYQVDPTIATAARDMHGRIQFNSNGFFTSPVEMSLEVTNGYLGAVTAVFGPQKISRSDVMLPCSPTTIINPIFIQDALTAVTTTRANSGCTFIR